MRALTVFYVQTRDLSASELNKRALELANGIQTPDVTLRQAILLGHTHNPVDTARAIMLTESVIKADNALKPYAQLLNAMWTERRKLEDQIDKQSQAGKDAQKNAPTSSSSNLMRSRRSSAIWRPSQCRGPAKENELWKNRTSCLSTMTPTCCG